MLYLFLGSAQDKESICDGDSGGPGVITSEDGTPILVALVEGASNKTCEANYGNIYVRISSHYDWILTQISQ